MPLHFISLVWRSLPIILFWLWIDLLLLWAIIVDIRIIDIVVIIINIAIVIIHVGIIKIRVIDVEVIQVIIIIDYHVAVIIRNYLILDNIAARNAIGYIANILGMFSLRLLLIDEFKY